MIYQVHTRHEDDYRSNRTRQLRLLLRENTACNTTNASTRQQRECDSLFTDKSVYCCWCGAFQYLSLIHI